MYFVPTVSLAEDNNWCMVGKEKVLATAIIHFPGVFVYVRLLLMSFHV